MSNTVRLDTSELDKIAAGLKISRRNVIKGIAFEIERQAKQNAPVLTGTLRASIHTVTEDGSTLGPVGNPAGSEIADLPSPGGDVIAIVGSGVDYAAYVELGTSKTAAQPFLGPAVESQARRLNDGTLWKEMFE
jgi:HK97 gp10 family phage protein